MKICKYCGGDIAIRNPTGKCDHLHWPDYIKEEAKTAWLKSWSAKFSAPRATEPKRKPKKKMPA